MRSQRPAQLQARMRATQTAVPMAAAGPVQPGIGLRPALDAGEIPTSVVTGDFNGDGHMDFVVANGLTSDQWLYLGSGDGTGGGSSGGGGGGSKTYTITVTATIPNEAPSKTLGTVNVRVTH